jgi:maleate isomerase
VTGTTARVGQLYPSGGLCDDELAQMAPTGVHVLTTRMPFRRTGVEDDLALVADLERDAGLLADAEVDLIAFNCTAASMLVGPAVVRRRIEDATGIPAITTIEAVVDALLLLDARRLLLLNPYPPEVERREVEHLAGLGIEVVATAGPSCDTPVAQGTIAPREWVRTLAAMDHARADAVLISCAGTRTAGVLTELEAVSGLPVVTSNQALLRSVLLALGRPPVSAGFGTILAPGRAVA